MPISPATVSSPSGSAGEKGGIGGAFDRAVDDLGITHDDGFHAAAGDPDPEVAEEAAQPDPDAKSAEPATPQATPVAKPPQTTGKVKEAAKPAAPAPAGPITAPANWDAQRKEAFGKLPPDAQKVLLDMSKGIEAEGTRKAQELAGKTRFAEQISSLVTDDHRRQMAEGGFKSVSDGLAYLIKLNDQATNDFPNYARWAVGNFARGEPIAAVLQRIFPEAFTGSTQQQAGGQQPQAQTPSDPQFHQVRQELHEMRHALHQRDQQEIARQQQAMNSAADNAIARFRAATDATGNPKYPHLARPEVEQEMIRILPVVAAETHDLNERLEKAYDRAVRYVPETFQALLDTQTQAKLAEQTKANDLAKARRARAPINAPPTGPSNTRSKGIDGALRAAMGLHGV